MAKFTIKPETLDAIRARDPNERFIDNYLICATCCSSTIDKLLQCSSCRVIYYCNRECQRKDWPQHKVNCKKYKEDKPIIETLSKYCKSLNRSRLETFDDCKTVGAILCITDSYEFTKLDNKHVFNMFIHQSEGANKALPYMYNAYKDLNEFLTHHRMMADKNSKLQLFSGDVPSSPDLDKLSWFTLIVYAPDVGVAYFKEIN